MPRPPKCRRVCGLPVAARYGPTDRPAAACVEMTLDEYEAIRLIDLLGYEQGDCARQMGVKRSTAQNICHAARRKLADALVNGKELRIGGGAYALCARAESCAGAQSGPCRRADKAPNLKEDEPMIIAVTYEDGQVFQHFGHTRQFKLYRVEDGAASPLRVVDAGGSGHGALAGFLRALNVDGLICGGIGGGARAALAEAGIAVYPGASGEADAQAAALAAGKLAYNPDAQCAGHEHGHAHEEGHACHGGGCHGGTCH